MNRLIKLTFIAVILVGAVACVTVDLNTPMSGELKAQYDFYADSMNRLRVDMKITPEQADEVFLALVSIGCDSKVTNVQSKYGEDGVYSVSWSGVVSKDVKMDNGVVIEIRNGTDILYPLERSTKVLNAAAVENATVLIEGLSPTSSRADYVAAQAAYDDLSKALKKNIGDDLLAKLSYYSTTTLSMGELVEFATRDIHAEVTSIDVVEDWDGNNNYGITYSLIGSENLTRNLTRRGMWSDCVSISTILQTRSDIAYVYFDFSMPLVDIYGNTSVDVVLEVMLLGNTLNKINFDVFTADNIPSVADSYFEYPSLFE